MQDLLNEEEFLKKPYNPWKLFYTFYAIAFIQLLLLVALITFDIGGGPKTPYVVFCLPIVTAFTMFFFKKKNASLPVRTTAFSLCILLSIYYIPLILLAFLAEATNNELAICIGMFAGSYILSLSIMAMLSRSRPDL